MEDIIHNLQMDHNGMPITGLFLVYPTYYIHLLEVFKYTFNISILYIYNTI